MFYVALIIVVFKFIDSTTTVYRLYNLKQKNYKKIFIYSLITEAAWMISFYFASKDDSLLYISLFIIARVIASSSAIYFIDHSKNDFISIKVITSKKDSLLTELNKYGISPVVLEVTGHKSKKNLLYITVNKRSLKKNIELIKECDQKAFITISNIMEVG